VGNLSHSWIGSATLDLPKAQCKVDVIHEAMERDVPGDKRWENPSTTFRPTYVHTLTGRISGKVEQRVLIGRSAAGAATRHPLLVDPVARSTRVLPDEVTFQDSASKFTVHEGAMYWSDLNPDTPHLFRIGFPKLRRETLTADCPDGPLVFYQGNMIVAPFDNLREYQVTRRRARGWPMQWWIADAPGKALRRLWPTIEDSRPVSRITVAETQHLGLIAQALINGSFAHYQAVFTGKPIPPQPDPPADGVTKTP
jgi:hypothetical protein